MSQQKSEIPNNGFIMTTDLQNKTVSLDPLTGLKINYDIDTANPKYFTLSNAGANFTDNTNNNTTGLERLALVQQAFEAVELPSNSTTLKINDTLLLDDGTNTASLEVNSSGNLEITTSGNTIFGKLPQCSVVPSTSNELVNKSYVDNLTTIVDTDVSGTYYPLFASGSGNQTFRADATTTPWTINPSTGDFNFASNIKLTNSSVASSQTISIGKDTGQSPGVGTVQIGMYAGSFNTGTNSVAVGLGANRWGSGATSVSIGNSAGSGTSLGVGIQGADCVAIGAGAGSTSQSQRCVAVGRSAGNNTQGASSVAVGYQAGQTSQGGSSVAVGVNAGNSNQGGGVAVGANAGATSQGASCVALGNNAAQASQGTQAIAIGQTAANDTQANQAIAIGTEAGRYKQGSGAIAIGTLAANGQSGTAGLGQQGEKAIAIGHSAGKGSSGALSGQGSFAIAIGASSAIGSATANSGQGSEAIAIGYSAGQTAQGADSIAIGAWAGQTSQAANSIILNATGSALNNTTSSSCVIKPVRRVDTNLFMTQYDTTTGELSYTNSTISRDTSQGLTIFGDAALIATTAGSNSGKHLVVVINGVSYKIQLLNV